MSIVNEGNFQLELRSHRSDPFLEVLKNSTGILFLVEPKVASTSIHSFMATSWRVWLADWH